MTDNEKVTINAGYFVELWQLRHNATENDTNVLKAKLVQMTKFRDECERQFQDKCGELFKINVEYNKLNEKVEELAKERDELKSKLEEVENREHASDADRIRLGYKCDESNESLAEAERCIEDVEIAMNRVKEFNAKVEPDEVLGIIRAYREKKEAK